MADDKKDSRKDGICFAASSILEVTESVIETPANFEAAILATGFGKFNIFLMLCILPTSFSQVFESVAMSYVLPVAQCDLILNLKAKGMLNAITFAGMITSGFFWGYLCDVSGRRKVMVYGYLLDGFFVLMASTSQTFSMLLVAKFFGGFIINGPFSAATSYLSEFHASQYRARVQLVRGTIVSLGNIVLPLLAWAVLPQNLNFTLSDSFELHSWNIFIFICSLAPITSGVIFTFMPESPKFLMSAGRNEEALEVFQIIYKLNTGKSADNYPVKLLIDETKQRQENERQKGRKRNTKRAIMEVLYQIKPLFCPPYVLKLIHACLNIFTMMMSINTLKLWLPQLFQAMNDYQFSHNGSSSSMCAMMEKLGQKDDNPSDVCEVNLDNSSVYINSIIVGLTQIVTFGIAGVLITMLGKKILAIIMAVISGTCAISVYYASNAETVLALASIFLAFGGVCANILLTITLELFPTTLRAMALSVHLMSARLGSVVGNIAFPLLIYSGCAPPFLFIGLLSFACAILSLLYPNTENKALT